MKRASYRDGVALIAMNDEPMDLELESVASFISTNLLAELFGVSPDRVAMDVVRYRIKHDKQHHDAGALHDARAAIAKATTQAKRIP